MSLKDTLRSCRPGDGGCLSYLHWVSPIYFTSFVVMVQFVLVNLVVAAITQALEENKEVLQNVQTTQAHRHTAILWLGAVYFTAPKFPGKTFIIWYLLQGKHIEHEQVKLSFHSQINIKWPKPKLQLVDLGLSNERWDELQTNTLKVSIL